ncbi:hypothetical protein M3Y99_00414800 [Aphelenchoides fujianensis]|nr:hypothetical protein M3Y99_00414800 [Aphelenchoides fujianensis]
MSNFPVVRAKSSVCLPRERDVRRGDVATLTRVTSVPNLADIHVVGRYQSSTLYKYRQNRNGFDDHYHDRYTNLPSLYWSDIRYNGRRFAHTDPIPNSGEFGYPAFWQRYKWYSDFLDPQYWRKYRDPYYDRPVPPLWDQWRPHLLDRYNTKRAITMYRQGLIPFAYLDKKWIEPTALGRRYKDWDDIYTKGGRYGARRYFYSFAA